METEAVPVKMPFWKTRKFLYVLGIFYIFGLIIHDAGKTQPQTQTATTTPVQAIEKSPISYGVVKRWTIPNGGEGKVIIVSPEYLNEVKMTALGEKLRDDTKNDRNAFISVFDARKAISLRDTVLSDEASATDQDFYDKHFIGQYTKNGNTGFNEFVIYFDGVNGTNQKTINY
ncbi:MAG: hypothetical protein NT098_05305 [Candidatus Parcubacteria bacterium]|nr:hypothetical protein [Candidatus Parcubacteria bacterium]